MIDVTSGGDLGDMTPSIARQFGAICDATIVRGVHNVQAVKHTKKLETKIDAFTTLVNQLVANQKVALPKVCVI